MKQKDAVYQAVTNVISGGWEGACTPDKEVREEIVNILFAGFRAKTIDLSRDYDDKGLTEYCRGLLNNWLRKDDRLNGGTKYVPKNPGSRMGSGDASLRAAKQLLGTKTDPTEVAMIQAFIDKKVAEIAKSKEVVINVDALPAELRGLVNKKA